MVAISLNQGENPSCATLHGPSSICITEFKDNCRTVECLVNHCADVNLADGKGETPLYKAVDRGCEHCVLALLRAGANVDQPNAYGSTVLMTSIELGHLDLTQLLLEHGADVYLHNQCGETALHLAAKTHKVEATRLLLKHGADPDATTSGRRTALSSTVNRRSSPEALQILVLLIRANANTELKGRHIYVGDGRSLTPFEVAVRGGNLTAGRLLALAGCNLKAARGWLKGIDMPRALRQDQGFIELLTQLVWEPRSLMAQCRFVVRRSLNNIYDLPKLNLPIPMLHYLDLPELDAVLENLEVGGEDNSNQGPS